MAGTPVPFRYITSLPPEAQREIERDFLHLQQQIVASPTIFDAIIDPALPSDPGSHRYKNLYDLALNETWAVGRTFHVGVLARAGFVITETANPDLSARGSITLTAVGFGVAGAGTPNWDWKA